MRTPREPLPPEVVESARKSLVISSQESVDTINQFDGSLLRILEAAIAKSEVDNKLRAALNRVLFTSRNATFAFACREELTKYKEQNEPTTSTQL